MTWFPVLLSERGIISKAYPTNEPHHYDDPDIYWLTEDQLERAMIIASVDDHERFERYDENTIACFPKEVRWDLIEKAKDYIREVGLQP